MAVNNKGLIGPCQSSLENDSWRSISVTTSSVLASNKHKIPPVVTSKSPCCRFSPPGRCSLKAHQSTQHKLIHRLIHNCQMNEGRYRFRSNKAIQLIIPKMSAKKEGIPIHLQCLSSGRSL